jgi:hypothetical protein
VTITLPHGNAVKAIHVRITGRKLGVRIGASSSSSGSA